MYIAQYKVVKKRTKKRWWQ